MGISNVLDLASRQASWLSARQNLVSQNVANANTPGYRTSDLKPFEEDLQTASLQLITTSPMHMTIPQREFEPASEETSAGKSDVFLSGNNVSLEQEMMKGGEIGRAYSLNTAVMKSFNGMLTLVTKS